MSEKHTPGPCKAISREHGTVNIESAAGAILGTAAKTNRLTYEEVSANARLWAGAGALLAACENLISVIEQLIPEPSARGVADVVLAQARDAIAKVEGTEQ